MDIQIVASSFNSIQQVLTQWIVPMRETKTKKYCKVTKRKVDDKSNLTLTEKVNYTKLPFTVCLLKS